MCLQQRVWFAWVKDTKCKLRERGVETGGVVWMGDDEAADSEGDVV